MSSKNYVVANAKKNVLVGHTYDGKEILKTRPNLHENFSTVFFNPQTIYTGGSARCDINMRTEDYNLNELLLEFDQVNASSTITQTIYNIFMIFSEIKLLFNDQVVIHLDNQEKIFCTVSENLRGLSKDAVLSLLHTLMPSFGGVAGETCAISSTTKWSLPISTFLFPFIKDISPSQGLQKLSLEVRMQPNVATADGNGRFIQSGTTANCYTDATISFQNMQCRLVMTKHSDPFLRTVPNPHLPIQKYADRMYNLSFYAVAVTKRIQLGTEFSSYRNINGVYVYIYDKAKVTTYNDTDCCKIDSDLTLLGYELKFKTRTVLKLDATTDKGRKAKYYYDSHFKRYGRQINPDLITNGTNLTKYFIPLTYIDLQSVANGSNDDDRLVYSGISNKDAELELIISNTSGAYSTDCYLYVVLSYLEFFHLDPKTGVVSELNL